MHPYGRQPVLLTRQQIFPQSYGGNRKATRPNRQPGSERPGLRIVGSVPAHARFSLAAMRKATRFPPEKRDRHNPMVDLSKSTPKRWRALSGSLKVRSVAHAWIAWPRGTGRSAKWQSSDAACPSACRMGNPMSVLRWSTILGILFTGLAACVTVPPAAPASWSPATSPVGIVMMHGKGRPTEGEHKPGLHVCLEHLRWTSSKMLVRNTDFPNLVQMSPPGKRNVG